MSRWTSFVSVAMLVATAFAQVSLGSAGGSSPVSFSFGASGDIGETAASAATLTRLAASGSEFFLALGDLSYTGSVGTETAWCDFVKARVGPTYPFEILSGNHEDNGPNGLIDNYVACLPDRLGTAHAAGEYGKQYYFDYPSASPLARFILISPGLSFTNGGTYSYSISSGRFNWLVNTIDAARAAGIPWVIVGVHMPCIASGGPSACNLSQEVLDLLTAKRVDLVLHGHIHSYQRSRQLRCAIRTYYVPECVVSNGTTGLYAKGAGTVVVVAGNAGSPPDAISATDPDTPYFAQLSGSTTPGFGFGYVRYAVSADRIEAVTDFSGSYQDRFTIATPGPEFPFSAGLAIAPTNPVAGEAVGFTATSSGGTAPFTYSWAFGDGGLASGLAASHAYAAAGTYVVRLSASDATGRTASASKSVLVTESDPPRRTFAFASAGDVGQMSTTGPVLDRLATSGTDFFLHTGDLSENTRGELQWCDFVKSRVGASYPYVILSGDDEDNGPSGLIDNFVAPNCLPSPLGSLGVAAPGTYAKEYFFDYPAVSPLARFIQVSPGLSFTNGGSYSYGIGSARFLWLVNAIDGARSAGIPWVIVAVHKVCVSAGSKTCESWGQDMMDLLLAKRVDLVLHGHDESYQRGKQLQCAIRTRYVPECVANAGSDGIYSKGAGTVIVITGVGGDDLDPISVTDPDYPYFAATMGDTTPLAANGFVKYTVYPDHIRAATDFGLGRYSDAFAVVSSGPTADFTFAPANPTAGSPVSFSGNAAGGAPPYGFNWVFGDGSSDVGSTVVHAYPAAGTYVVSLTVRDSLGTASARSLPVTVEPAPPEPLVAGVTFAPGDPETGEDVSFTASASGGTPPFRFDWDFGDGATLTDGGANLLHAYGSPGSFLVVVTVNDSLGVRATASASVDVRALPLLAVFAHAPSDSTVGDEVFFSASASGGLSPYSFDWDFGDSESETGNPVTHAFGDPGLFPVTLTVTDSLGTTTTVVSSVVVNALPLQASFTVAPTSPFVGDSVTFTGSATGGALPYRFEWDFGDASPGSGASVDHAFASGGTYTVLLTVYDAGGTSVTALDSIVVRTRLSVDFTFDLEDPAVGEAVSFASALSGGIPPYAIGWDFGDGGTASTPAPTHTYATAGTFHVVLNVDSSDGQSASVMNTLLVSSALDASLTWSPSTPSAAEAVTFEASASGGSPPYSFEWSFGDGSTQTGSPAEHTYATAGTFLVAITVVDNGGRTAQSSREIVVSAVLAAAFTYGPPRPNVGDAVLFSGIASGGSEPHAFAWDFGDFSTGSGPDPSHAYGAPGEYVVVLSVTDAASHAATATHTVRVTEALVVDFSASPEAPVVGSEVTFSALADGGTAPYAFTWSFGDGGSAGGGTAEHVFADPGSYPVTLTVTDADLVSETRTRAVVVSPAPLVADFLVAPASPIVGETVTFDASSRGGTPPVTFAWDFGDGSPYETGRNVVHAYAWSGTFLVILTAADNLGQASSVPKPIGVGDELTVALTISPSEPDVGETVAFTGSATGGSPPYALSWDFGDSTAAAVGETTTHVYAAAGTYAVTLTMTDDAGRERTAAQGLVVMAPLEASLSFSPPDPAVGEAVAFGGVASGGRGPYAFTWDFGDGAGTIGAAATHAYAESGTFTVRLTVEDARGRSFQAIGSVRVGPSPMVADFVFSPSDPIVGEAVAFAAVAGRGTAPYSYAWNFGDGTGPVSGQTLDRTFTGAGTYVVTLNVTDAVGRRVSLSKPVTVRDASLSADFAYSPANPETLGTIAFISTISGGTPEYVISWDFGDGATDSESSVTHAFSDPGTYAVAMTVVDATGASVTVTKLVVVA